MTLGLAFISILSTIPVSAESNGGYVAKYVGASVGGQYVNISSTGNVYMEVVPTTDGSMSVTKDNIAVETNADTGYRLYISGYNTESNGYTALYKDGNTTSSSKIVSIPTNTPISFTGSNAGSGSSSYLNTWGWAVGYNASNGASAGFSEDSAYSSLANTGTVTDSSTIASLKWKGISGDYQPISSGSSANEGNPTQTNIYYATYVNKDMPNGNYRNIAVYTAFVEGSNNITVSPNEVADGDIITVETEHQRSPAPISADQIRVQLYDHTDPSKDLGTCDNITVDSTYDGTTNRPLKFTCTYQEGVDAKPRTSYDTVVQVNALNNGIYISYSKENTWHLAPPRLKDGMAMQDVTSEICAFTPTYSTSNKTYTLIDNRDNKKYLVRRLNDGKCWMVQNLALSGNRTIYGPGVSGHEEDSNLPSGVSYPIPDGTSYASKFGDNKAEHMYNGTHKDGQNDNTDDNTGAYYNWNVATAGYDTTGSLSSGSSDKSICPKGWKLPSSGGSGDFNNLYAAYGSNKTNVSAVFNLSAHVGYYYSGSLCDLGSNTYWWSSTIASVTGAYSLYKSSSGSITPSDGHYRFDGFSVRCVAQ